MNLNTFGMTMPGRSFCSSTGYRYGYEAQEKDTELDGDYAFKYRIYDPRIGRFLSRDPLASRYAYNSPYAFCENRVIDSRELEGLERVTVNSFSFAPFNTFGGGYRGDGENRKFGDPISVKKRQENFRIGTQISLDLATWQTVGEFVLFQTTSIQTQTGIEGTAKTNFQEPVTFDKGVLFFQIQGTDAALLWGYNPGNIDVKANIKFQPTPKKGQFKITGEIYGDRYPANETYLTDEKGNKLFLGVSGVDNENWYGPEVELLGTAFEGMSKFSFYVEFNEDNSFKRVILNDGTTFTLEEWNKIFTNLKPASSKTGTNVTNNKVITEEE